MRSQQLRHFVGDIWDCGVEGVLVAAGECDMFITFVLVACYATKSLELNAEYSMCRA